MVIMSSRVMDNDVSKTTPPIENMCKHNAIESQTSGVNDNGGMMIGYVMVMLAWHMVWM